VDSQVRFTPDGRISWLNGLNQKEKLNVSSNGLLPMNCLMPFLGTPVFGILLPEGFSILLNSK